MTRIFTLIFLLLLPLSIQAQQEDEKNIKNKTKRAILQIQRLKKGALIVRLFDKSKQIELLNKQGKSESIIKAYEQKIATENNEVISAFKNNFTFCPVYFFYSKDSKHIKNRDWKNVHFVDNSNSDYESLSNGYFYTADISELRVDTLTHFITHDGRDENNNQIERRGKKSKIDYEALVIKSDKFIDLLPPFPYSVRTYKDLPVFKRSISKTVQKFNTRLELFYKKYEHVEIDQKSNKVIIKDSSKTNK